MILFCCSVATRQHNDAMISDIDKYLQGPKMYFFWFGFSTPVDLGGGVRVKHLIWNLISTTSRPTFLKSWDSSMFGSFESKTIFLFLFDILVCFTVHGFLCHIFFSFMMHNVWHETIVGVPVYHLHCFFCFFLIELVGFKWISCVMLAQVMGAWQITYTMHMECKEVHKQ